MKIATKLVFALVVLAASAAGLGTLYSSGTIRKALHDNISKSQYQENAQIMDKIDRFLYERTIDMQNFAERSQVVAYVQKTGTPSREDSNQILARFIDFRISAGVWGDMTLLNKDDTLLLSSGNPEIAGIMARGEFKQALLAAKNGQVTASDVFQETDSKITTMVFIAPVRSLALGRPVVGYVLGELAWSTILQMLVHPGENVSAHLFNKDGFILGSSSPDQDVDEILIENFADTKLLLAAKKGNADINQANTYTSFDAPHKDMLSTFVHEQGYLNYKGNNWLLVFETPAAVAFAPATKLAHRLIISSVAITLLSVCLVMWYGYRSIIRPVRLLRGAMLRIIGGDRDSRVKITTHDEIGELGHAFNQMSESLEVSEQLLREGQARLSASINSLEIGFFMTDLNDQIVTINSSARTLLTIQDSSSISDWNYKNVVDVLKCSVDLEAVIKSCKETGHILKIKEVNFNDKVLSLFAGPILSQSDNAKVDVIGTVVLLEDITEVIVQARSKDEFFSIASHELRTPLTSIRGNSSMIMQIYADILKDPSLKEMIEDIHESSTRLIEIVNDFLDVSRIEQGKMKFTFAAIKLDTIIEKIVYEMKAVLKEKHLSLDIEHKTLNVLPSVLADSDRVKQVIYNLIGNAVKFTEQGGVRVTTAQEHGMVKVIITDTGRGVSPEGQKMLFRKFQQAGNSLLTRDTTKGTGLGLYISKLLVEGMGGKIALEHSEEGKGTSFSFTLPIAAEIKPSNIQAQTSQQHVEVDVDTGLTTAQ